MLVYGPAQQTLRLQLRYASSVPSLPKACVHVQDKAAPVSEISNEDFGSMHQQATDTEICHLHSRATCKN